MVGASLASARPLLAQAAPTQVVEITLGRMVELAMNNSFRIRRVELNIERTQHNLPAEQAGLRSRVDLDLQAPQFEKISKAKYNSILGRNEIVSENFQRDAPVLERFGIGLPRVRTEPTIPGAGNGS